MPILLLLFVLAVGLGRNSGHAQSGGDWPRATPEEVGIDSGPLIDLIETAQRQGMPVHSLQLVRQRKLILDVYFYPYDGRTRHDVASVTKSITSTLVGLAIDHGQIRNVDQPLQKLLPLPAGSGDDPRRARQTVEDLLTMRSGWDCGFEPNEARLFEMRKSPDWLGFMLGLPMAGDPGKNWAYCSGNCHVLSILIARTTGTNALAFGRRELFAPLGIHDVYWTSDPAGNPHGWGDLQMHPLDMAKIGQLFLQRGSWQGRQIISEKWVRQATRAHALKTSNQDRYGYYWWVKGDELPGMFEAVGRGGQRITVWPAKELVIVFTGGGFEPGDLGGFILKSLKSDSPLPPNPEAHGRLQAKVAAALEGPAAKVPAALPAMARRISGRSYSLTKNELDLSAINLRFEARPEAHLKIERLGQTYECAVGLDGVLRFSTDKLVELPFACKGEWESDRVFNLELDRVAGVSLYRFRMEFSEDGKTIKLQMRERTGLSGQEFTGTAI